MIYFPLKDHIPVFENNIIKIEVLNTFQQDQYQMHKRAMLEYWRTHFTDNVDDIEITLNEHLEVKKIIFTAEDKLKNLQEQNPKITDFMNILNFKIKNKLYEKSYPNNTIILLLIPLLWAGIPKQGRSGRTGGQ